MWNKCKNHPHQPHQPLQPLLDLNQTTGDAIGGPGLAVGGNFNGSISGGNFTGGNATSGSNSVTYAK
jgi:hypothetical protein